MARLPSDIGLPSRPREAFRPAAVDDGRMRGRELDDFLAHFRRRQSIGRPKPRPKADFDAEIRYLARRAKAIRGES